MDDLAKAREAVGLETFEFCRAALGELLLKTRLELNLTLAQVQAGSGVAASHIWNIERGQKDFSAERLARLAAFYGFPPGLILETALRTKHEPILKAAIEEIDQLLPAEITRAEKMLWAEYTAGLATALAYLLRCTRPTFLLETLPFPSFGIKNRMRIAARNIEFKTPVFDRLLALQLMPVAPRKALGFFDAFAIEDAERYATLATEGSLPFKRPWNPVPSSPILDIRQSIVLPPMSIEERAYLNSLRVNAESNLSEMELTNDSLKSNTPNVSPEWQTLKLRIQQLTEASGKRAQLADWMGVERPRVSEWLSPAKDSKVPGGENMLRLLKWVAAEEAKQKKSSGSAATPSEPKTQPKQKGPSNETKRKSGPKKR